MGGADHLGEPVITIAAMAIADADDFAVLRHALWPNDSVAEHREELVKALAAPERCVNLIARWNGGTAVGFAEASIRHDYVNGCHTSPAGFLEGIYVDPHYRREGVASQLVLAVEDWARRNNCTELASDAALDNDQSHGMHDALGFIETQRVVYFRKVLL